jgi:CRP-like cAMP-binding protein
MPSTPTTTTPAAENRLLAALPDEDRARLLARSEIVRLDVPRAVHEAHQPIPHVYFPLSGVVSLTSHMDGGDVVEVGLVGSEGMVGLPVFLGADSSPFRAFAQVPGEGRRVATAAFLELVRHGDGVQSVLHRYTHVLLTQTAQAAACNRLHPVEQRLARWLLMTHDRVADDRFPLTHQFLGMMLGVRRASVSIAAGMLQQAGLIRYHRGVIEVLDRAGLEAASCDCYRLIRTEYERVLPPPA